MQRKHRSISRRQFLRGAALLGSAATGWELAAKSGILHALDRSGVAGARTEPHINDAAVAGGKVEYDYIVIGSGAGGGPVAANLARAGYEVLVLEAGGLEVKDIVYTAPAFHLLASADPRMNWNFFVKHYSEVGKHGKTYIAERGGVLYPRASAVGGCTAHHVMLTLYPENRDWDDIAASTDDPTWGSYNMRQYFERVKSWLPITHTPPALLLRDQVVSRLVTAAALETNSLGRDLGGDLNLNRFSIAGLNLDPNDFSHIDALRESLYMIPQSTENGERRGTRERLLNIMEAAPDRLFLQTHALVQRILFDPDGGKLRATGVEFLQREHLYEADPLRRAAPTAERAQITRRVRARREVIVAGGAFNSPQILMLSGIGPR